MRFKAVLGWTILVPLLSAQQPLVQQPAGRVVLRPYKAPTVPPVRLANSDRLHGLIRANMLYLTVQDAVALAIENNLNLEVDRYGPLDAIWNLERQEAGGALSGVTSGNNFVNQITGGLGVAGAVSSAGLGGGGSGNGGGGGGQIISQIGPITPNLDPVFQNSSAWQHQTIPQANPQVSKTVALVDTWHRYGSFVQEGLLSGGIVQATFNETYLKENTQSDLLNPAVAPAGQIFIRHSLLNGFGVNMNNRYIRIARKNVIAADQTFRSQLVNLVSSVVNLYWDLASANEDLKARQHMLDVAQRFFEDTGHMIELGAVAKVEILRAEAEVSTRRQELAIAQASIRQQENVFKNVISRNGLEDPQLDTATVVPTDRMEVPVDEELPPLRELVARALKNRPDIALSRIGRETAEMSALGTANGILPSLQGTASLGAHGNAGTPNFAAGTPSPNVIGGLGSALGQVFRGDYTNRSVGLTLQAQLNNHVHQADYGIDQLQLRQGDLIERRSENQLVVDISNQMVALKQARSRYVVAVDTRHLQEQLLEKERQSFALGTSTINNVIAVQRSLAGAQAAELATLNSYSRARVGLDQVLGETLEASHILLNDALAGRVH